MRTTTLSRLAFAFFSSACAGERPPASDDLRPGPPRQPVVRQSLACIDRGANHTLIYSAVERDPVTQDLSGFEVMLLNSPRGISGGSFREAAGEFGPSRPLTELRFDSATAMIAFAMPMNADSSRFEGRFSCDSVWGTFKAYPTTPADSMVLHRVRSEQRRR